MTEKGLIYLACLLVVIALMLGMVALWRIGSNITRIAKRLIETNDKLQDIYLAQKHTGLAISSDIKGVSEAVHNVYDSMFNNAEVTISRNGIEEESDGKV